MAWTINVSGPVAREAVALLGVDPGLRLISLVKDRLQKQAGSLRLARSPNDPACFEFQIRPFVVFSKGGWYEFTFAVDDQTPDCLSVTSFISAFRPIGPIGR